MHKLPFLPAMIGMNMRSESLASGRRVKLKPWISTKSCRSTMQLLDEAYLARYYKTPARCGYCMHDLYLECRANGRLAPFQSASQDMRVLASSSALFYTVRPCTSQIRISVSVAFHVLTLMRLSDKSLVYLCAWQKRIIIYFPCKNAPAQLRML